MTNALTQYLAATSAQELTQAYESLIQNFAAENPSLPDDADFEGGVDSILWVMGVTSFSDRLKELEA
jgi:hypothetical protein